MMQRMMSIAIAFVFLFTLGACNDRETLIPEGMEKFVDDEANISTVKPENWERIDYPEATDENAVVFQSSENTSININQSIYFITTNDSKTTNILKESYRESDSYDDFVDRFIDRYSNIVGSSFEKIDEVDGHIPVFSFDLGEVISIFAIIESNNTPYFIHLKGDNDSSEIESSSYEYFINIIKETQPLK
ncbi:hypothetical protein J2S74_000007 [Evansella vedderi]|uniref:Lipoprotein n=1 Tax=Evansella vedderi TaxID=38282 RepID=A0ABT9ZNX8_9BACI|nr:hypothetical protein [Evansella vedderi]MDQ0252635.1 hypothetical protein [Evansella vedderi]